VNGGAIALGHPLDKSTLPHLCQHAEPSMACSRCTGARQIATGLSELQRRKAKVCIVPASVGIMIDILLRIGSLDIDVYRYEVPQY